MDLAEVGGSAGASGVPGRSRFRAPRPAAAQALQLGRQKLRITSPAVEKKLLVVLLAAAEGDVIIGVFAGALRSSRRACARELWDLPSWQLLF